MLTARVSAVILLALLSAWMAAPAQAARSRAPAALGAIASTPDGSSDPLAAIDEARKLGLDPLYTYISPRDLRTPGPDAVVSRIQSGGRAVVNFSVVATTVLGKYPDPWRSFTDPGFAEAFAADAGAAVSRWKPAYACLGNEAGTYLATHPAETDAYERVLRRFRDAVRAASPSTRVCVVLAFRDSVKDGHALAKRLAASADLVSFTAYGYRDPGFRFVDPAEGLDWIRRIESEWKGAYAISETGWSSSKLLGSSEAAQAAFVRALVAERPKLRAEFIEYFYLRDGKDCTARALAFLTPEQRALPADRLAAALDPFKAFLCNFGIERSDGTRKPAAGELP